MENHIEQEETKTTSDELLQLVGFNLGEEEYGVDILKVQEINRMVDITQVPQSPPYVDGVINLRGTVIPVINLRTRLSMTEKTLDKQSRIIVAEVHGRTLGFVVDAVSEVIRIPSNTVEPPPPIVRGNNGDFIDGVGKMDDRLLMLLDMDKLFSSGEIDIISSSAEA